MPAIATTLVERNDGPDFREWQTSAHTLAKPALLKQMRKSPTEAGGRASDMIRMIFGANDATGVLAKMPLMFEVNVTRQANMAATEATTPLSVFRDVVNSDAFAAMVTGQSYIK
jgi:hypothetical protein